MALPANLSSCTVTATYLDSSGTACTGKVVFTPTAPIKATDGSKVLFNKPITAALNGSGTISATLPVGDTDYATTITYLVSEQIDGTAGKFGETYYIALVAGDASNTIPLLSRTRVSAPS